MRFNSFQDGTTRIFLADPESATLFAPVIEPALNRSSRQSFERQRRISALVIEMWAEAPTTATEIPVNLSPDELQQVVSNSRSYASMLVAKPNYTGKDKFDSGRFNAFASLLERPDILPGFKKDYPSMGF